MRKMRFYACVSNGWFWLLALLLFGSAAVARCQTIKNQVPKPEVKNWICLGYVIPTADGHFLFFFQAEANTCDFLVPLVEGGNINITPETMDLISAMEGTLSNTRLMETSFRASGDRDVDDFSSPGAVRFWAELYKEYHEGNRDKFCKMFPLAYTPELGINNQYVTDLMPCSSNTPHIAGKPLK